MGQQATALGHSHAVPNGHLKCASAVSSCPLLKPRVAGAALMPLRVRSETHAHAADGGMSSAIYFAECRFDSATSAAK